MAEEQREQVIDEEPEKLSGEGESPCEEQWEQSLISVALVSYLVGEPSGAFGGQKNPLAPTRLAQETRKWRDRHMIPDSVRSLG